MPEAVFVSIRRPAPDEGAPAAVRAFALRPLAPVQPVYSGTSLADAFLAYQKQREAR